MNQNPIFILGAHKSGTSLLRSILDGHSQLFTVPIEAHFFQNMKYWVENEYRLQFPENINKEKTVRNFTNFIKEYNDANDEFADSMPDHIFNVERFKEYFSALNQNDSDKERIQKYFKAIYYSITGNSLPDHLRVVEKSVENAEFAIELNTYFPSAKFVHIIRNPYSNFVALRKYKSVDYGYALLIRLIKTLRQNYYYLYKNQRIIENYHVIRYEDLVKEPEKRIQKLCDILEIPFEDILLEPTYLGKPWGGNSMTGKKFNKISASSLEYWKSEIYPMEVQYVNHLFYFVLKDFGYKMFDKQGSFWKRARGENIQRYVANRLYRFLLTEWKRQRV